MDFFTNFTNSLIFFTLKIPLNLLTPASLGDLELRELLAPLGVPQGPDGRLPGGEGDEDLLPGGAPAQEEVLPLAAVLGEVLHGGLVALGQPVPEGEGEEAGGGVGAQGHLGQGNGHAGQQSRQHGSPRASPRCCTCV